MQFGVFYFEILNNVKNWNIYDMTWGITFNYNFNYKFNYKN